jgi:hypothetical protein
VGRRRIAVLLVTALATLAGGVSAVARTPAIRHPAAARRTADALQPSQWNVWYDAPASFDSAGVTLSSPASTAPDQTYSTLVTSKRTWRDQTFELTMTTDAQLRTGSSPNPWEVAWLMFRFRDRADYYWFILKTNGFELGKKQGSYKQIFLVLGDLPYATVGVPRRVRVKTDGARIEVWVDGDQVVDYVDPTPLLAPGSIGLYEEDSRVRFDSLSLG